MGTDGDVDAETERSPEYQRSVLEAVIETVPNGILVVDDDRNFFTYNRHFVEMWNIPETVVESGDDQRALDAVLDSLVDPEAFLETVEYFYDNPHEEGQNELELSDGRIFDRYTAPVTDDGTYYGRVWVFEDVTERVRNRRELKRKNDRLEEFMGVLSHDLQSPLNVAMGRTELAQAETDCEHLDAVARSHERMQTMLDDLLTLARGEEGVENVQTVQLGDLARESWETVPTADASLAVETKRSLAADPRLLRELLENLFGNAVRHGGEAVTVTVGDREDGFYVADDGVGIPAEDPERVFETRYTTSNDGTGLGLSIVEQVAEAHGWTVSVAEGPDGGARFDVTGVDGA